MPQRRDDFEDWLNAENLMDEFLAADWPHVQRIIEWFCQACEGEAQTGRLEL